MGLNSSREAEVSARLVEALEEGHLHTLALLFKFVQHCEGGAPATQIANRAVSGAASKSNTLVPVPAPDADTLASYKPRRAEKAAQSGPLDAETAAFHARAAALARTQAEANGLQSASFPIPIDLNTLRLRSGDTLLLAAVKRDQPQILRMILDAGADVDMQDAAGWTALHHAAHLQRIGCAGILLQAQALTLIHNAAGLLPSQCTRHAELRARLEQHESEQESRLMAEVVDLSGGAYVGRATVFEESGSATFPLHLYSVRVGAEEMPCPPPPHPCQIEVFFRGPALRQPHDCICLYYVDDPTQPHVIRPRVGSVFYIAEKRNKAVCVPPKRRAMAEGETGDSGSAAPSPAGSAAPAPVASNGSSPAPAVSSPLSSSELARLGWDSMVVSLNPSGTLPMGCYRFVYFDSARNACLAASDVFTLRPGPPAKPTINTATPTNAAAVAASAPSSAAHPSHSAVISSNPASSRPFSSSSSSSAAATATSAPGRPASSSSVGSTVGSIFSFLYPWSSSSSSSASTTGVSSAAPSPPVALHPSFSDLSAATPRALAAFLVAPPPYFRSHFQLNAAAVQLALQLDPTLGPFKARFVPTVMREEEFWARYFYNMSRLEQPEIDRDRYSGQMGGGGASGRRGRSDGSSAHSSAHSSPHSSAPSTRDSSPSSDRGGYVPPVASPSEAAPPATATPARPDAAAVATAAAPAADSSHGYIPPAITTPTQTAAAAAPSVADVSTTAVDAAPAPSPAASAPQPAPAPADQAASAASSVSSSAAAAALAPVIAPSAPAPVMATRLAPTSSTSASSKKRAVNSPDDDDDEESSYVPPSFAALPLTATTPPAQL